MARFVRLMWWCVIGATLPSCEHQLIMPDLSPRLLTSSVWSGGEIQVRVAVRPPDGTYLVLGADSLATVIVDDSTLSAPVPQANGQFHVSLKGPAGTAFLDNDVRVFGFRDFLLGPPLSGYPLIDPASPTPKVLANGETTLVSVDLRFGLAQAYPRSMHDPRCMRGPGPTPTPNVVLLGRYDPANGECTYGLWQLSAQQMVGDSMPGSLRIAAEFSANRWLIGSAHQICLRSLQPAFSDCRQFEEPNDVRFSPRADRAIVYYAFSTTNGVPVFNTATGDTSFTIHDAQSSGGGSFSSGGDTLFIAVYGTTRRLLVVDATGGQRLTSLDLAFDPEDVLAEPASPYVYVFGWTRDTVETAHLQIFERPSMRVVGHELKRGSFDPTPDSLCFNCDNRLVLDPTSRILYVLGIRGRDAIPAGLVQPSPVSRFDLPPY
ncbi:MAG: YncE family protein [Solirubrobacterales bacterium]